MADWLYDALKNVTGVDVSVEIKSKMQGVYLFSVRYNDKVTAAKCLVELVHTMYCNVELNYSC